MSHRSTKIQDWCIICGERPQAENGKGGYRNKCIGCHKIHHQKRKGHYRKQLKEACERCGFKPIHKCQLDVDHVDGNHNNNKWNNLQTLCANCHRIKTWHQTWKKVLKTAKEQAEMLNLPPKPVKEFYGTYCI